jgi:hypothetical protein
MKLSPYTRSEPAGDPGSLDPSEARERLHDLFNLEAAISRCAVLSSGVRNRIAFVSRAKRRSIQGIPPCDHESTGVAPVNPQNKCAVAALAAYLRRGISRTA